MIKPLLACSIDAKNPTAEYNDLKKSLEDSVARLTASGDIESAGIYVRNLDNGFWTSVNGDNEYVPASLMKIVTMFVYLLQADTDPSVLNETITIYTTDENASQNIVPEKTAEVGKAYTVQELLELMMEYSDNTAKRALVEKMSIPIFQQVLEALELPMLTNDETARYTISPRLYSRFLRILYNSTLISQKNSEIALEWMAKSNYTAGLVKGIGESATIAHKFGETSIDNPDGSSSFQHHDCGIVYSENPYAICIMTQGKDLSILAKSIASFANTVNTFMVTQ
jgi:beta-lactamase class A